MEELLKEILSELKKLNENVERIENGYNIYDVCSRLDDVKTAIEGLDK
jgi:hypothetical protein